MLCAWCTEDALQVIVCQYKHSIIIMSDLVLVYSLESESGSAARRIHRTRARHCS